MKKKYRICVVIVNYNTSQLVIDCIDSVIGQLSYEEDYIVIVDNCSKQSDLENLKQKIVQKEYVGISKIIEQKENTGFSAGNNAGIEAVEAQYYLLTNSDTLFHDNAVGHLLSAAGRNNAAGLISPQLEWPDNKIQISNFRYPSIFSEMMRSSQTGIITSLFKPFVIPIQPKAYPSRPEWTSFACVLIKREVFQAIGMMDERFFMYYEDIDFCRRARSAGFEILNYPESRVIHLQGQSSDFNKREETKKALPDYYYYSRSWYYIKYFTFIGYLIANVFWLSGFFIAIIRKVLHSKPKGIPEKEYIKIWKFKRKYT